jgi:hypothetical protein
LSIRATVQIVDLAQAQDDRLRALSSYLRQCGAQLAGPPFVRYHTFTQTETDVELGIPVVAPIAGEGRIAAGELGGGPAIRAPGTSEPTIRWLRPTPAYKPG